MNPPERRALLLGTLLVVLGGAVRVGFGPGPARFSREPADESRGRSGKAGSATGTPSVAAPLDLARVREGVDRNVERSRRAAVPLSHGERIDINTAPVEELERLPGVGPATARRIVRERERTGGFERPQDLSAIPGLGAKRVNRILPYLLDHSSPYFERPSRAGAPSNGHGADGRPALPSARTKPRTRPDGAAAARLDVNVATEEQLERLPGVGPAIARRIVTMRDREGPFKDVQELRKVPGIGPARFDLLKRLVTIH